MTFIDTNYFLRFLLKDVDAHYQEAMKLFLRTGKGDERFISSTVVFFEVFWVLRSVYQKDKQTLVQQLEKLLKLNVEFDEHKLLVESVGLFKDLNLSLEDCYNLVLARAKKTRFFKTFDIKLEKIAKDYLSNTYQVMC